MNTPTVIARRPAETGGLAVVVAAVIARIAGLSDPDMITYLTILAGAIPTAITWAVELFRARSEP
mgnify:CR=1 FL=1